MAKLKRAIGDGFTRCAWVGERPHFIRYHDEECGAPIHDDQSHFEMLLLEGAQAGLTWETILLRRGLASGVRGIRSSEYGTVHNVRRKPRC
jgi:hypothetical protein